MKYKKILILLFTLMFCGSLSASIINSPEFMIGPIDTFGEMSAPQDPNKKPPWQDVIEPKCPRGPLNLNQEPEGPVDPDKHEANCSALNNQCIEGCLRRIKRKETLNETRKRKEICIGSCNGDYIDCLRQK